MQPLQTPISTLFPYTTLFRSGSGSPCSAKCAQGDWKTDQVEGGEGRRCAASHIGERVGDVAVERVVDALTDRKSTRLNSSHVEISYAVFCLKKKRQR